MKKIPTLILSKDRAPQLRLLIESLYANATGIFEPYVLWKATTQEHQNGYHKLQSEKLGVNWSRETYMLENLYAFLQMFQGQHFALFMDDCIFYKPLRKTPEELLSLFDDDTWCLSLRLGENTTESTKKPLEPVYKKDGFIKYNFKEHEAYDNYGFYFSWDGVVYNTDEVLKMFNNDDFYGTDNQYAILPQKIENFMSNKRDECEKNIICCPTESHVVSMNYNSTHPNASFNDFPLDELLKVYLEQHMTIDFDTIDFNNINGTHDNRSFALRPIML